MSERRFLSAASAARRLGISRGGVYTRIFRKQLPIERDPGKPRGPVRIPEDVVDRIAREAGGSRGPRRR